MVPQHKSTIEVTRSYGTRASYQRPSGDAMFERCSRCAGLGGARESGPLPGRGEVSESWRRMPARKRSRRMRPRRSIGTALILAAARGGTAPALSRTAPPRVPRPTSSSSRRTIGTSARDIRRCTVRSSRASARDRTLTPRSSRARERKRPATGPRPRRRDAHPSGPRGAKLPNLRPVVQKVKAGDQRVFLPRELGREDVRRAARPRRAQD